MRKKRKFALQAVLDYRRHLEEAAFVVVAEFRRRCDVYTLQHNRCVTTIEQLAGATYGGEGIRIDNARICETLSARLRCVTQSNAQAATLARADLDGARHVAVEAARDRRVVEILRERHREALAVSDRRAEEAEIEEVNAIRPGLRLAGWR
jgi:flagellar export protein FliJ